MRSGVFDPAWRQTQLLCDPLHGTEDPLDMLAQGQTKQLRSSLDILALHRCLVTNPYGSTNSSAASLTVTNPNTPPGHHGTTVAPVCRASPLASMSRSLLLCFLGSFACRSALFVHKIDETSVEETSGLRPAGSPCRQAQRLSHRQHRRALQSPLAQSGQGLVGLRQREHLTAGAHRNRWRQPKKLLPIASRQVGHRTDTALVP